MIVRWTVYTSFLFTWIYSFACVLMAETPAEWFAAGIALIVVPLVFVPMVEAVEE
jgi:hypothetical protein